MRNEIFKHLVRLAIPLVMSCLVWLYYKDNYEPQSERYSTFGPRFWAGPVDSCALLPIGFITSILLALNIPKTLAALLVIVESLAWLFYTVVMHGRYGQTVGKIVTKVRVVDYRTEGRISYRQAWLREGIPMAVSLVVLGYQVFGFLAGNLSAQELVNGKEALDKQFVLVTALPSAWFVAEVLTMLTNRKRRALHDFIAGTVVVRLNIYHGDDEGSAGSNVA